MKLQEADAGVGRGSQEKLTVPWMWTEVTHHRGRRGRGGGGEKGRGRGGGRGEGRRGREGEGREKGEGEGDGEQAGA